MGDGIRAVGVVLHPGSAKGGDVGKAIARAGKVIKEALAQTDKCHLHLEDTAGAGGTLGRSFEELEALLDASGGDKRLGVCLDSCHLLSSGYEVRTVEGLHDTLKEFDRVVGRPTPGIAARQRLGDADRLQPRPARRARPGRVRREGLRDGAVRAPVRQAPMRARDRDRQRLTERG